MTLRKKQQEISWRPRSVYLTSRKIYNLLSKKKQGKNKGFYYQVRLTAKQPTKGQILYEFQQKCRMPFQTQ